MAQTLEASAWRRKLATTKEATTDSAPAAKATPACAPALLPVLKHCSAEQGRKARGRTKEPKKKKRKKKNRRPLRLLHASLDLRHVRVSDNHGLLAGVTALQKDHNLRVTGREREKKKAE